MKKKLRKRKLRTRITRPDYLNKMIDDFWNAVIVYNILDKMDSYSQFSKDYTEEEQTQLAIQYAKEVDGLILNVLRTPDSKTRTDLISSQSPLIRALLVHRCSTVIEVMDSLDNAGLVGFLWPEFSDMAYSLLVLTRAPHHNVGVPAAIPDEFSQT
ncbi:hypothetical protein M7775_02190 [Sporomusa sphaeroides DSM 2875]|uniref:hypothetical protein n=1 Tax=Sporomusa sphaeroides TaxID=47679 RepID=UPI002030F48C|nr:hypothetical protein [Sporomusa sphaeroides]MCM0757378.1 hypothetical protein [Sporomusa sphaeroides DSM 2875]